MWFIFHVGSAKEKTENFMSHYFLGYFMTIAPHSEADDGRVHIAPINIIGPQVKIIDASIRLSE
ncbi:hypothetical protein NBRC116494_09320 [Aurantivibrio plasticivorans]